MDAPRSTSTASSSTIRYKSQPGVLTATMPDGLHPHGIAPRGYYMVFVVNTDGVPSEARFVFLH